MAPMDAGSNIISGAGAIFAVGGETPPNDAIAPPPITKVNVKTAP